MKGNVSVVVGLAALLAASDVATVPGISTVADAPMSAVMEQDACLRPTAGLVALWPLDETAGSIAADAIGGSDGALIGTTSVAGRVARARRFGPGDSMTADGSAGLNITGNQVTVDAWIKLETAPTSIQTFTGNAGKTTFPSQQAYQIAFETGPIAGGAFGTLPPDRWRFEYILTNAGGTRVHNQNTGIDIAVDGNYHHFAMVYDGANVRLYVDAVLHGTFGFTGNLLNAPPEPVKIFGNASFSIDDVGVYSRALSAAEIQTIVCASAPAEPITSQLVFASTRDGDFDIYVMNDDGSGVVQLTNVPGQDSDPAWSPDGRRIAFASSRDGDFEIFVMNADGTGVTQVTHTDATAQDRLPKWSPDGRFLVFHRPFEPTTGRHVALFQVELATGTITGLTPFNGFGSSGGVPDWSPDARIIFQRHTDQADWELMVREINGAIRQLTFNSWDDVDPDWFPGGTRAAFTSTVTDGGDIRGIVLATGAQIVLTSGPDTDVSPAVSCDGSRVAFVRVRSGSGQIWVMAANGTGQVNISNNTGSDTQPDWRCVTRDATAPQLTLPAAVTVEATSASGAIATYSVSATDDEDPDPVVSCTPASGSTFAIGTSAVSCTATDASGNIATGSFTVIVQDTTPPIITASRTPAPNANGWNNTDVTIDFSCTDSASGVAAEPADVTLTTDGANRSASASCRDAAGNTASLTVDDIDIDKTPPSITLTQPADGAVFLLHQTATASYTCSDAAAGVVDCAGPIASGAPLDTSVAGARTFAVVARDAAGNTATLAHPYAVQFGFDGFVAPLNNLPATNRGPAGRTFPVKFTLRDATGAAIGDAAAISGVAVVPGVCSALTVDVAGEETSVDLGGLKYDALTGVWQFNWQTARSQTGCWTLELRLADGSVRTVQFELR